jgi:hypothetical protein
VAKAQIGFTVLDVPAVACTLQNAYA